ncbi:HvfC/BufC N-terminal domain-containing protein [Edaphobacter albus]|uniref:HvfC/BufC N-terminal domain-containing protein n=1 Tax=Edaphobacter sp. 4G125 TaxID=2763071 RepID=UPI001645053B|nr:DNA-binding domain-containing protein [Edaphobacter sp. 4G125]QNI36109.1 putative DNA-binding domain-containing protein [Edaphobacter sp. 4G125]
MNAPSLYSLQKRMAAAVMRPLTRNEQMRRRDENNRPIADEADSFIKPNDRLSSFERLEIYNRQYWFRLFSSFEEDFPGLKSIVGARRFERLMRDYLNTHPSRSFTLRNLGSSLVPWLRENPQYTQPETDTSVAMAALEWAHIEAFDNEQRSPLTAEEIASLTEASHLALQPYLQLVDAPSAIDDALLAVRDASMGASAQASNAVGIHLVRRTRSRKPAPEQIYLAIHRHENSVYYKRLQREDYLLLQAIRRNASLGEAIEAAFTESSIPEADRPAYIQSIFQYLMQMGWLCIPRITEER